MLTDPAAEEAELRAKIRAFCADHDPAGTPRDQFLSARFDAGLAAVHYPVGHGGLGLPRSLQQAAEDQFARAGAPAPVPGRNVIGLGMAAPTIIAFGTDEQLDRWLKPLWLAEDIWCQLFSEPGAGSDLAGLSTRARREGDEFVIDGQKVWTTNGQHADVGYLLARTDPDAPKHRGITAFALDMDTPGVDVRPLREITGTSDFNEVFLDSVRIPAHRVIGQVNDGWRVANSSLAHERSGVAARGADLHRQLDDLLALAGSLRAAGRPALEDGGVRQRIGRLATDVQVADLMSKAAQSRMVHGTEHVADAPLVKIFFSETNLAAAELGVSLQGPDSITVEGDQDALADGWWQDAYLYARAYTIAGGANEVLRNVVAERALGLPREPR